MVKIIDSFNINQPRSLQKKVWFDIALYFARRGSEGFRSMNTNTFIIKTDPSGCKYVTQVYHEN